MPDVALLPIKLLALYLVSQRHVTTGLMLVIAAKLGGTAITARLFQLTHPALMRMAWFARIYSPWKTWKDRVLAQVRKTALWRAVRYAKRRVVARVRKLWFGLINP